jgi:hypothetical protein
MTLRSASSAGVKPTDIRNLAGGRLRRALRSPQESEVLPSEASLRALPPNEVRIGSSLVLDGFRFIASTVGALPQAGDNSVSVFHTPARRPQSACGRRAPSDESAWLPA